MRRAKVLQTGVESNKNSISLTAITFREVVDGFEGCGLSFVFYDKSYMCMFLSKRLDIDLD